MTKRFDRQPLDRWELTGAPTFAARIDGCLRDILRYHRPSPHPNDGAEKIRAILNAVEAREGS